MTDKQLITSIGYNCSPEDEAVLTANYQKMKRAFIAFGDSVMMSVEGDHIKRESTRGEGGRIIYRRVEWDMADTYLVKHASPTGSADQGGQ